MDEILLVIDNLQIGGFQRLALDQSYCLAERGFKVTILVLDRSTQKNSLENLESHLISQNDIVISHIGGSRSSEIKQLAKHIKNSQFKGIVCHSLRGTIEVWIAQKLIRSSLRRPISTTIHQLPTLSAPVQRFLRFTYAQFSDQLFAYSEAVKADWSKRLRSFPKIIRHFYDKPIKLLRNGIYLERLPQTKLSEVNAAPRLIYLGRLREWKGLTTFYNLGKNPELSKFNFLMMVPEISIEQREKLNSLFGKRIEIVVGKTIAEYKPQKGDIHIYPTNYGDDAEFVESISLNCLEFACLGIPSIVSRGGLSTWTDLGDLNIFRAIDWNDSDAVVAEIISASQYQFNDLINIRDKINIRNNINQLFNIA